MKRTEHTTVTWEMDSDVATALEGVVVAVHDWAHKNPRNGESLTRALTQAGMEDTRGSLADTLRYLIPSEHVAFWRQLFDKGHGS